MGERDEASFNLAKASFHVYGDLNRVRAAYGFLDRRRATR